MPRLRVPVPDLRALRLWFCLAVGVAGWLGPGRAQAGLDKRVESSTITLELSPDGAAIVRHELRLEVPGGRLSSFALRGVDSDAEPLADATLIRLAGSQAEAAPEPLTPEASDGVLELSLPARQPARGTSFLLRFGYRTRLAARGLLQHDAESGRARLEWVGPRYDDGVDAVTWILRTPAAASPPEVAAPSAAGEANYGTLLSTLRRTRDQDELELVRTHVARDEAMPWSVSLDRALLSDSAAAADAELTPADSDAEPSPAVALAAPAPSSPFSRAPSPGELGTLGAAGLAYALLVGLKARAVELAARQRQARARAWIAWPAALRALVAGSAFAAAGAIALWGDPPLAAALALLIAMAFAAHHPPERQPSLQGPGEWKPLDASAFETPAPAPALPGAWLDAGRVRGFLLLGAALGGVSFAAARAFDGSPFTGACLLLGGAALLPIFCTGRASELPLDGLAHGRRFLGQVHAALARDAGLVVTPLGRIAAANDTLDELRLSITPARSVPGLLGVELGLELRPRIGGFCARPAFIVRAVEGSECQRALPRGLTWTRGRSASERATLVRPKLPTPQLSVALLRELMELLVAAPRAARNAAPESARSAPAEAQPAARAEAARGGEAEPAGRAPVSARDAAPSPLAV